MAKVRANITVSLDGFVAGRDISREEPLGEGGERLHDWMTVTRNFKETHGGEGGETGIDDDVSRELFEGVGAIVMGRGMFGGSWTTGDEWNAWEGWWGDDPPYHVPVFVLTHHAREPLTLTDTTFYFVTDGIESAIAQARESAGDKDVLVMGGGNTITQATDARLVDELDLHLVPFLLGGGARLFDHLRAGQIELEPTRVIDSPKVTHLRYRVVK
jgi:dihydrofolate reductase